MGGGIAGLAASASLADDVVDFNKWNESPKVIAEQYDLPISRIEEALAFYQGHQVEVDLLIRFDTKLEENRNE